MAQHHVHWGVDTKWLFAGALLLWLITRPKKAASPPETKPYDDYLDANHVTWSLEQPAGAPVPVPYFIAQALDGAYAGVQLGPLPDARALKSAIDKYAVEHKQ